MGTTVQPLSRIRLSSDVHVPRLRDQRLKRAFSQQELADASGVSRTTIIKIEAGRAAWPQTVRKLAKALRVRPEDLR